MSASALAPAPDTNAAAPPDAAPDVEPPRLIGLVTRGTLLAGCDHAERASELGGCGRGREGKEVSAVLPIACYYPAERRWDRGNGCASRRGLRFSPQSPPPDEARPWVRGGCYGSSTALGLGANEVSPGAGVIVAPPEHAPIVAERTSAARVAAKVLRRAVTDDMKARAFSARWDWRTLSVSDPASAEIDGDGKSDVVFTLQVRSASEQRYGAIMWSPFGSDVAHAIDAMQWPDVTFELAGTTDLDEDGRRELLVRSAHESVGTSVYAWRDGRIVELGGTSCGP